MKKIKLPGSGGGFFPRIINTVTNKGGITMHQLLLALTVVLPSFALAKDLKINSQPATFNVVTIRATQVKGVSVRLAQKITRKDCNQRSINTKYTVVDGNDDFAWYQTAYMSAATFMTEMHCPLPKAVTETVYSQPVELKSLMNRNADGEVDLKVIVPVGYTLEAAEIQK